MTSPAGGRVLRVDMTTGSVVVEPLPERWRRLGGRGLSARILLEECDPTCDPLGPDNLLVFAPGLLSGTAAPTSGRLSIGAKSPLTNGIKESNVGGDPGQDLKKLGFEVVVVSGRPADREKRYGLSITADGAALVEAPETRGLWNYALVEHLAGRHPRSASFVGIGPAGELGLKGASIACTDRSKQRRPARHAARGGLGAVMGSKGLKYVAIDAGRAPVRQAADREIFLALAKGTTRGYLEGPQPVRHGTSTATPMANLLHTLPTHNRRSGQSPHVDSLDGMRIVESFETRGGGMHNCMTGCIVRCSNVVHDAEGEYKTSALEFETIAMLGSNCGLSSWEDVADLDRLCDELGLDTIETGAAVAIYMDSGGMEFGDADGLRALLREIAEGTERGRMIGNGALATGRQRGHRRVPVVRGQAIPAWDPRPLKATGVTYLTSAMAADHTAGLVIAPAQARSEMARASQQAQLVNALVDSSGFCMFLKPTVDDVRAFYAAYLGEEISREEILELAWGCLQDEWEFNQRAGWRREDDVMPDCMREEGVGPDGEVFDVSSSTIQATYERTEPDDDFFTKTSTG